MLTKGNSRPEILYLNLCYFYFFMLKTAGSFPEDVILKTTVGRIWRLRVD